MKVDTNFILDGSSGKMILRNGFLQESFGSKSEWNYVYSANNQPEAIDGFVYPGYYLPEDRAKNYPVIEPKSNWDKESVGKMITDNTSSVAPDVVKNLISNLDANSLSKNEKKQLLF
jgi:penicillin amidase